MQQGSRAAVGQRGEPRLQVRELPRQAPGSGSGPEVLHPMGTAVPPVLHMEVEMAPQASVAATMPHCLVHATQRVQLHLLSAGVELASDLAGWFAAEEEVWAYAAHKGWLGADLQAFPAHCCRHAPVTSAREAGNWQLG